MRMIFLTLAVLSAATAPLLPEVGSRRRGPSAVANAF